MTSRNKKFGQMGTWSVTLRRHQSHWWQRHHMLPWPIIFIDFYPYFADVCTFHYINWDKTEKWRHHILDMLPHQFAFVFEWQRLIDFFSLLNLDIEISTWKQRLLQLIDNINTFWTHHTILIFLSRTWDKSQIIVWIFPNLYNKNIIMSTVASTITSKLSAPGSAQKKKSTSLPAETVDYLKAWMMSPEHIAHPYPTEQEKAQIMAETGIELKQLTNWFVNNRKRYWKPRVEARLQHQTGTAAMPTVNHGAVSPAAVSPLKRKSSGQSLLAMAPLVTEAAHPSIRSSSSPTGMVRRVSTVSLSAGSLSVASLQGVVSDNSISESYASSQYSSDAESGTEDCDLACDDEVSNEESVARTESVDVHILKPLYGPKPTIADVSILSSVPTERILCTYEHCPLKYSFPLDSIEDRKKVRYHFGLLWDVIDAFKLWLLANARFPLVNMMIHRSKVVATPKLLASSESSWNSTWTSVVWKMVVSLLTFPLLPQARSVRSKNLPWSTHPVRNSAWKVLVSGRKHVKQQKGSTMWIFQHWKKPRCYSASRLVDPSMFEPARWLGIRTSPPCATIIRTRIQLASCQIQFKPSDKIPHVGKTILKDERSCHWMARTNWIIYVHYAALSSLYIHIITSPTLF